MIDTVYIVTSGSYSDYHIVAVFDSEAAAMAFLSRYDSAAEIEPHSLNTGTSTLTVLAAYWVWMLRDGKVMESDATIGFLTEAHRNVTFIKSNTNIGKKEVLISYMFARDEQHAIKIANERRAFLIATEQWSEGDKTAAISGFVPPRHGEAKP